MKKLKLRNWVKVVLTIMLIAVSVVTYINLRRIGEITSVRIIQEFLGIFGWGWLFGQPFLLSVIWE